MKKTILHISNDYPDPLNPVKTMAILNLVEATPEFRHVVYSLNRTDGLDSIARIPFGEDRHAVVYGALPKGFFWKKRLEDIAEWIKADLAKQNITPDLVQAHKITVEGMAGIVLADHYNVPLVCDIQASSDLRVFKNKPGLHSHFAAITKRSACIFPYAPWVVPHFASIGMSKEQCINLPVLPGFDALSPSTVRNNNKLVMLMRFSDRANKNILGVLTAIKQLQSKYPGLHLDVYGGGQKAHFLALTKDIEKMGAGGLVTFKGPIANGELPNILGQYTAYVMPSFMETYGLVYAEALFCGLPVIFSTGQAIDGYFETTQIGHSCNPKSAEDIAASIDYVLVNEDKIKRYIAAMQQNGQLDIIRRDAIISTYKNTLLTIIEEAQNGL